MLIDFKGLKTEDHIIPPFQLNQGEMVLVYLYGGGHYYPLKSALKNVLTRRINDEQITIHEPLLFVDYFKEPTFRKMLYPVTVGEYIKKNGGPNEAIAHKIYAENQITESTRVNTLNVLQRKLLSLYVTVSKTKNIIFDLDGLSAQSSEYAYRIVKNFVKDGLSAIYIDWCDEYKNDCTTYVELQWRSKIDHNKIV